MKNPSSKRLVPVGVGVATLVLTAVVVGIAQIPTGERTAAGGTVSAPAQQSSPAQQSESPSAIPETTQAATPGPSATAPKATPSATAAPGSGVSSPPSGQAAPAPGATQSAQAAPPPAAPPAAPAPQSADAQTVQRVRTSCTNRMQSDAASSGVVTGTAVGRPYTLVALEFAGTPERSSAKSGLASYDVVVRVTTKLVDGPVQANQRVCRVYDSDSHVDWLPVG